MIAYVGIGDACRNADHPGARGQQRRFADAEASPKGKNSACAVVCRVGEIDIGIVNNGVADGVIEAQDRAACVVCARNRLVRERDDLWRVTIDEGTGGEVSCYIIHHRIIPNLPLYLIGKWPTSLDGRQGDGREPPRDNSTKIDFSIVLLLP